MLETFNIVPCPDGPNTMPIPTPMTPGTIALAALGNIACMDVNGVSNPPVRTPSVAVGEPLYFHPMLAVVKVQREDPEGRFIQLVEQNSINTADRFGPIMTTKEESYFRAIATLQRLENRFGNSVSFSQLEALDLSDSPFIYVKFLDNLHSLFVTQTPFHPCWWDLWLGGRWNIPVAEWIRNEILSDDRTNVTRTIEEWYASACAITLIQWVESQ